MVVGARQFFRQNTWFLENNRVASKFLHGILHYLISITKSVHKTQCYTNHVSHTNQKVPQTLGSEFKVKYVLVEVSTFLKTIVFTFYSQIMVDNVFTLLT